MTLWQGRFAEVGMDESLASLSKSIDFDQEMVFDDIEGSKAHVFGLGRAGILTKDEASEINRALDDIALEFSDSSFVVRPGDEDVHTAIERRVIELVGPLGGKLHTGRSRNDQVATALRLWSKRNVREVCFEVMQLQEVLLNRAQLAGDTYLPGYTHLQRAQPVLLSHHLLAHGWALSRDVDRLIGTLDRLDVSPLGAGALAGSSLPLDPASVAKELGFSRAFENSLDAVSDRDFVAEILFDVALIGVHLSRLGEEIVLWTSDEFGFCTLDDRFATGSSMLPQKKNPDIAELARGKCGRFIGHVAGFLATLKGLPLSYNRDLQEDKEPLFDSVKQILLVLAALRGLITTAVFHSENMEEAANAKGASAVDLAEFLVGAGMPFRDAHSLIGQMVRDSNEKNLDLADLARAHKTLGDKAADLLRPGTSVSRRTTQGGAGPEPVAVQIEQFSQNLDDQSRKLTG